MQEDWKPSITPRFTYARGKSEVSRVRTDEMVCVKMINHYVNGTYVAYAWA